MSRSRLFYNRERFYSLSPSRNSLMFYSTSKVATGRKDLVLDELGCMPPLLCHSGDHEIFFDSVSGLGRIVILPSG